MKKEKTTKRVNGYESLLHKKIVYDVIDKCAKMMLLYMYQIKNVVLFRLRGLEA